MKMNSTKAAGPARMSRTAGGGTSHGGIVAATGEGKSGDCGMGSNYSGGKNTGKTQAWGNPSNQKTRTGQVRGWAKSPDKYQAVSHNPSGASNSALQSQDRTMADDT